MSDIAIKVEHISKRYQIGENKTYPTLRDKLMELPGRLFKGPKKNKEFWVLRDVSFEVKKGEVVGIIGRNGAGKSTMLKILSRITEPTSGQITMYGRVASMLEVGTGFNPELTGRENIYLNGAIIGMTKSEIKTKFDDIVEFSGVGKFLDTPVKHYSSGMYIRLAFAVAAHLDADILLVDEVLAVGDAEFQKKCLGKMSDLASSGKTVIFVSHNAEAISKLCNRAIYLKSGELIYQGYTMDTLGEYYKDSSANRSEYIGPLSIDIVIEQILINSKKTQNISIKPDENLKIKVLWYSKRKLSNFRLTFSIYVGSTRILSMHDVLDKPNFVKGNYVSEYIIPASLLRPSNYDIYFGGYQPQTKSWFYGNSGITLTVLPVWSATNEEANIGIVNISNGGKRAKYI